MIKLKTINKLDIRYSSCSLSEFIKRVRENVPDDVPNEDVQLEFESDSYAEYDPFGDGQYTIIESDLLVKIEDKTND